jgi:hypothetical protein
MRQNLLLILFSCLSSIIWGQVPQGIPYQAVARDAQGNPMANQSLTVQFSLHEAIADGQVVYQETQTSSTNAQGLFSLTFGAGVPSVGTFTSINWGSGYKFLQVQANFGNGYVDLGTQQLMSVPYALYSGSSGNGSNQNNSNYNPSADSVLTLIGKASLYPGTYTVPSGETWELESFNDDGNSNPTMNADYWNCENINLNSVTCVYAVPEDHILVFRLDGWEFNVSGGFTQGIGLPNGQIGFRYTKTMLTTNYDCSVCGTSAPYTFPTNLTAINLNLPIYANSGQQLFIQNGFRVSVSKYK